MIYVIYFVVPLLVGMAWGLVEHWLFCAALRRREREHRRRVGAVAIRKMNEVDRLCNIHPAGGGGA